MKFIFCMHHFFGAESQAYELEEGEDNDMNDEQSADQDYNNDRETLTGHSEDVQKKQESQSNKSKIVN